MSRIAYIPSSVTVDLASYSSNTFTNSSGTANGANSSAYTTNSASFTAGTRNTAMYAYYVFGAMSIPSDATISAVSCTARGYLNNSSRGTAGFQLLANNTAKGSETTFTNTSASAITLTNVDTWNVSELTNTVKLRLRGTRTSNNQTFYVRLYGATLGVDYLIPKTQYEVNVSNTSSLATISPDTTIWVNSGETQDFYLIGIQDKNDVVLKDNGTDVTNSLVYHEGGTNTASVDAVAGASYGFALSEGYYTSQNKGVSSSAALCRINMNMFVDGTLTLHFINYAEATYDYGLIGQLDTALGTTSAVTNDTSVWMGNASSSNTSTEQTVTINVPAGNHFVDIKFRKDSGTNSNNDNFQFRYELSEISPDPYYTYTLSNVTTDHTITVEDGNVTKYDVNASSSFSGVTVAPTTQSIVEGKSATVNFTFDHLYEFIAKDNGAVISIPEPIPETDLVMAPSAYVASASTHGTVNTTYPTGNGLTYATSTTYTDVSSNTAANSETKLAYRFDCSSIPQGAVIESVVCTAKASASTTYFGTRTLQLYNGDTAKGSPITISNNTVQTLTPGTWTREELDDIMVVTRLVRTTSTTSQRFRFYGATLTVTYSVPSTYTINNVQANHTITVEEAPYYGVTFQNSYAGASFSVSPTKIYSGQNATVTLTVDDIDAIHIFDNGVNVDSSFVQAGNVYTYALTNVTTAHTISTVEATRYTINASSNYTGVTISPATASVIDGKSATFTIEPHDESIIVAQDVILLDNNVDVTSQLVTVAGETGTTTGVLGTFDPDMSSYVGIYNNYNYTNAEGHTAAEGMASTTSTRSSFYTATGAGATIMIVYNLDASSIVIPDGATIVNVSCQSVHSIAYSGQGFTDIATRLYSGNSPKGEPTDVLSGLTNASAHTYTTDGGSAWTVSDLSQAKLALYGTRNNTNSNNDNTGIRDNVNFHGADLIVTYALPGGCTYTVSNVQGAHTLVVNEKPSVTYNITVQSTYSGATVSPSSAQVKQGRSLSVHIAADHLYEIVVKDNGIDVTSSVTGSEGDYTYNLTNISEGHTILVEEGVKYAITASSTYANATITPASMNVYQGQSGSFSVETPSLSLITLEDNGYDVTNNIVFVSGETFNVTGGTLGTFDATNSDYVGIYNNYDYTNAEGHTAAEGLASSSSTRSSFYPATGSGETVSVVYNIDTSQIALPADTVIVGVTSNVVVSVAFSGQGYSYVSAQLYSGLEPMGEPTVIKETANLADANAHQYEVDGGPGWTLNGLSQVKMKVYGVRNDINSTGDTSGQRDNVNIHGADLVVHYNYITAKTEYTYTVENVTTAHTLVLRQVQQCAVSTASHLQNVSISSSTQSAVERDSVTITITGDLEGVILMDNGVDVTTALVFDGETAATYTIMNIHGDHTIVATAPSLEADYIKTGGEFKRVKGYWKKINGTWTLISRESFSDSVTDKLVFYGGVVEYQEVGEITKSGDTISLAISDNALPTGDTYTLMYEDINRNPISGIDKITDFTL